LNKRRSLTLLIVRPRTSPPPPQETRQGQSRGSDKDAARSPRIPQRLSSIDQPAPQHLPHVVQILRVATLDFGERLCVQIEMVECERAFARKERTTLRPPRVDGDEIRGGRELHVQRQLLLEPRDGPEESVVLGHELHVHIDRRGAPPVEHSGRAAREVHARRVPRRVGEGRHESMDAIGVGYLACERPLEAHEAAD
jgi:hypothetical protein